MDGSSTTAKSPSEGGIASPDDPELSTTLHDFANLDYQDKFWPGRRYEDQCDRIALRALLPSAGARLMDVGAGFGRLADEFARFREVVLLDPSDAMLGSARERVGDDPRFTYVSGTAQHLPVPDASFDAIVCVRVLHHIRDLRPPIAEFARVLRPGGVLIIETSNKRNLRAILAFLIRRQRTSPFRRGSQPYVDYSLRPHCCRSAAVDDAKTQPDPHAAVERWSSSTWYLHAPKDVRIWLAQAGFRVARTRSVGLLRPAYITRHVPLTLLVALERLLQPGLATLTAGPSMFVVAVRQGEPESVERQRHSGGTV